MLTHRGTRVALLGLLGTACGANPSAVWSPSGEDSPPVALIVPNLDDDDGDGAADWTTPGAPSDDDLAFVEISNKARPTTLSLEGDADAVRVYHQGRVVLGQGAPATWSLPDRKRRDSITLQVEAATWGPLASLVVQDDRNDETATLQLVGSPPTMGHHLLPTEAAWVLTLDFGGPANNNAMIDSLQAELGDLLSVESGPEYGDDPWMQDEPEFSRVWSPESEGTLILDSIRDGNGWGGLDPFPETLAGVDVWVETHGQDGVANTYDAFGNLEVSPPVTVDGVSYPLGRVYYGWNGTDGGFEDHGPQPEVRAWLEETGAQAPFFVDTSWLCVGHIDEYTSFIPDPSARRGFRFLVSDTGLGLQTLQQLDGSTPLVRHARRGYNGHDRPDIDSYVQDAALVAYNQDLQRDHIEPAIQVFRDELALTDEEIVRVPAFFEEVIDEGFGVCGAAAVVPGTVNLLMVTNEDGTGGTAFIPDPFVRSDVASPDQDPFIAAWKDLLPDGVTPVFLDNWFVYHMGLGEVHCATNQRRTPALATVDLDAWLAEELGR